MDLNGDLLCLLERLEPNESRKRAFIPVGSLRLHLFCVVVAAVLLCAQYGYQADTTNKLPPGTWMLMTIEL